VRKSVKKAARRGQKARGGEVVLPPRGTPGAHREKTNHVVKVFPHRGDTKSNAAGLKQKSLVGETDKGDDNNIHLLEERHCAGGQKEDKNHRVGANRLY